MSNLEARRALRAMHDAIETALTRVDDWEQRPALAASARLLSMLAQDFEKQLAKSSKVQP